MSFENDEITCASRSRTSRQGASTGYMTAAQREQCRVEPAPRGGARRGASRSLARIATPRPAIEG
eukprot:6192403-Pleurochrysis_carterae.AAC.8